MLYIDLFTFDYFPPLQKVSSMRLGYYLSYSMLYPKVNQ